MPRRAINAEPLVDLTEFSHRGYEPGVGTICRVLWLIVDALVMRNPLFVSYRWKATILRLFGARVGRDVVIKPAVHVKYPWRLTIGDYAWIGERAWIDNMDDVDIGAHAVVSQGVYFCTGNHDWSDKGMGLTHRPITMERGSWVGAFARVAPGVRVGTNAIVGLGAVLMSDAAAGGIYQGNPAREVGRRYLEV